MQYTRAYRGRTSIAFQETPGRFQLDVTLKQLLS